MKTDFIAILLYFSAIGSGINAGLFFIFSNTIMEALGKLKSDEGIAAMKNINRVILNPLFFLVFFGTALSSLALIIISFLTQGLSSGKIFAVGGSLCYLLGCIVVTITCNVPRNEALDKVETNSKQARQLWVRYLKEWTTWNHVRAVACALAMSLLFIL